MPTDSQLEVLFRTFWSHAGYSAAPPGSHALMTHIAWGRFLLEHLAPEQQAPEQSR